MISLLATLLILSACSNRQTPTIPEKTATVTNPVDVAQQRPISEDENDLTQTQATAEVDLLERIRRGFQFPPLKSKHTQQYIDWSTQHPTYLNNLLKRAEPFLFYIVEEIDKRGLPMELALLPAIESAYKPNAISRSKAGGLWQFIPSTANDFGVQQNWWYDGRRDVIESTNAALDYLTQLNKLFDGDWFLSLAAYNAGQGTVLRAIKKNKRKGKNTNYQKLSLRNETVRYVPKLQALKDIISNPQKYNVNLATISNQPYFEVIDLPGQIDLPKFAEQLNIEMADINHLNAGFLRWATPPNGPHRLLTPISNSANTQLALQQLSSSMELEYHQHLIRKGQTISHIAKLYGVTEQSIQTLNRLPNSSIRAGKTLMVPVSANTKAIEQASTQLQHKQNNKVVHRVAKGDTLWSISRRYKVGLQELLNWNKLAVGSVLQLNQAVFVFTK